MHVMKKLAVATALSCVAATSFAAHHEGMSNKAVAEGWWNASCGELDGFISYVDKHMADNGVNVPDRYVGLGFNMDYGDEETAPTVMRVTPGTPAAAVLKAGDEFVSVGGMAATWANRDKLSFRGEPGAPVKAVIMRDGKKMDVEITRGVIEVENDKERALAGLRMLDGDNWGTGTCEIEEVVQEGNVVYLHGSYSDTEEETGIPFEESSVIRFEFNDEGKVAKVWTRGESRFVLEQLGYSITR